MLLAKWARLVVALVVALATVVGDMVALPQVLAASPGRQFYVDSRLGSDGNAGTSAAAPWRSLARLSGVGLTAGDDVFLAAGSEWQGPLVIRSSGVAGAPITFQAYGEGAKPAIHNPAQWGIAVEILGSYVEVDGLLVHDTHYVGISIDKGASHNTIRNCEATRVGIAFALDGDDNLVTSSYAHDLTMVTNTPGGDDDFGAIGVLLGGSGNEVSYNLLVRCSAVSSDYGFDGSGIEWYGTANGAYVHHNWVADSAAMLEAGGGSAVGAVVAYNVSVNNGNVTYFHLAGRFASDVRAFRFENNTVVDTGADGDHMVFGFTGTPAAGTLIVRNNVIYAPQLRLVAERDGFTHDHNLYWVRGGDAALGLAPGTGEKVADPLFVDLDRRDFRLQRLSPARGLGTDLGYRADFAGRLLVRGVAPDAGAYQYTSKLALVCPLIPRLPTALCQAWSDSAGLQLAGLPTATNAVSGMGSSTRRGRAQTA